MLLQGIVIFVNLFLTSSRFPYIRGIAINQLISCKGKSTQIRQRIVLNQFKIDIATIFPFLYHIGIDFNCNISFCGSLFPNNRAASKMGFYVHIMRRHEINDFVE